MRWRGPGRRSKRFASAPIIGAHSVATAVTRFIAFSEIMKTPVRTRLIALMCLLLPAAAQAQSPIIIGPTSAIAWEIAAPDAATANGFTYAVTVDGGVPKTLAPVACIVAAAPIPVGTFTCTTPIAQIPTGSHQLTLTAASGGVVSLPSTPYAYVDMLIPVPQSVRAKP